MVKRKKNPTIHFIKSIPVKSGMLMMFDPTVIHQLKINGSRKQFNKKLFKSVLNQNSDINWVESLLFKGIVLPFFVQPKNYNVYSISLEGFDEAYYVDLSENDVITSLNDGKRCEKFASFPVNDNKLLIVDPVIIENYSVDSKEDYVNVFNNNMKTLNNTYEGMLVEPKNTDGFYTIFAIYVVYENNNPTGLLIRID
jgi:hypothetical protein